MNLSYTLSRNPNEPREKQLWKPVSTSNVEYLYINNTTREMRRNPFWDEFEFWKSLGSAPLMTPTLAQELFKNFNNL